MHPSHTLRRIVFDFGGVLIDWNPRYLYRRLFDDEMAMENFLDEISFADWNYEQDKGRSFADAVALHSETFPHHAEMIRAYDERWLESVGGEIAETVDILRALKRAGYPLFGLSNWSPEKFALVRAGYEFFELFDAIVLSGDVKIAKPDVRIFHVLLEQIGYPAQACLFIDDSFANVAVARELGFQTIHFESPEQLAQDLRAVGIEVQSMVTDGIVQAVSVSSAHTFSKPIVERIQLLQGCGVQGDAHCGETVKHRSRVKQDPTQPNLRQVHLIHAELHDELKAAGFRVNAGDMGENITTRGIPLLALPADTRLYIGATAVVQITGLRNPCSQLDDFQTGLMNAVLDHDAEGNLIRKAGVMGIVLSAGEVKTGDPIRLELPPEPHRPLERV